MALYSRDTPRSGKPRKHSVARELLPEQQAEIREAFELFDGDKDGSLNHHEFKVALRALGFDKKKEEVRALMRENDKASNGQYISESAFNQVLTELITSRDPLEEVRRAFRLFDDRSTGKISLHNLKRVAKELGENLDDDELQAMIDEFDLDQDGEINEQEFIAIMTDDL